MKKMKPVTARELLERFGKLKLKINIDKQVADARRGWKSEMKVKRRKI